MRPAPLAERFWSKVKKTKKCWVWVAHTNNRGYGQLWVREHKKKELAHRVSWFLATGKWPIQKVLHSCDNPACVRHSHHFQGTQAENLKDMRRKGRGKGWTYKLKNTHCPQGHPYSGENLRIVKQGKYTIRTCRECNRIHCRNRYAKEKNSQ